MLRSICASLALLALSNPALAASGCATPADATALKTAVMQQQLMVAAFQCHEAGAYNRFVMIYQGELQSSDAALKTFFIRRGTQGEAGYDTFKTRAANLSALEQARHSAAFCADTHALFAAAFAHQGSLTRFVETQDIGTGNVCVEPRPSSLLARADAQEEGRRETDGNEALPPRPRAYQARNQTYEDRRYYGAPPAAYGPPPGWREPQQPYGWYPRDDRNR